MYSLPEAYFFTFRTYGTWLHGDERGSTSKLENAFDTPHIPSVPKLQAYVAGRMNRPPVYLDAERREAVETAVRETCAIRDWEIHALNVRTNHIHVVASVGETEPEKALNALKGNATRVMREGGCWESELTPWAKRGSKRYLWKTRDVQDAVVYVMNGQGDPLDG